ncbi:lysophospholipid acyltransferase family protein [Streptomyces sp. NBC_01618]|uniref:lysophospholipid acyltransferase family protein n=1 Tax=Streptomyces sp. NBC_01618 TaxID=2975900 RepID=UPI00386EDCD7|nr:1-acyl-sn-glycerol-3-phosphate acyltransferase [Streptomyces sp. NBC_01618]
MNPWVVEPVCTPACAKNAASGVSLPEAVRRYASVARTVIHSAATGERLAGPETLRAEAGAVLTALGIRLDLEQGIDLGRDQDQEQRRAQDQDQRQRRTRQDQGQWQAQDQDRASLTVPGPTGTLVVANHISWLDVVVLLAIEPVTLLAKREVGTWPLIGTLARRIGTRFIDREDVRELPSTVAELARTLRSGQSVMVFPQGTTWCSVPGGTFRRATFQAAVDAGAPVRPVTIDYFQQGVPSTVAGFLGDEGFATSLHRVVGARELSVRVTTHRPLTGADRRSLAAEAQRAVSGPRAPAHA